MNLDVGWVEGRRLEWASRRVTQQPKALLLLGFTSFNPTYIYFYFPKVTGEG